MESYFQNVYTQVLYDFHFICLWQYLVLPDSLINGKLKVAKQHLSVVLIFFSLITRAIKHFANTHWSTEFPVLWNVNLDLGLFSYWFVSLFFIKL